MEPNRFAKIGSFRKTQSDFTVPENSGLRFLINPIDTEAQLTHPINKKIDTKWKKARVEAKGWWASRVKYNLGEIQNVAVQSDVWILNSLCQKGDETDNVALEKCLVKVAALAKYENASIHVSELMFGVGNFEELAKKHLLGSGLNVYVYKVPVVAE